MASLGNIRWGVQYTTTTTGGTDAATKTLNGLDLDESATAEAESVNAEKSNALVVALVAFSDRVLTTVSLIETRRVENG